jgi:hypothetical protein
MERYLDDVVDLYQRLRKTKRWVLEIDKTVAQAVGVVPATVRELNASQH